MACSTEVMRTVPAGLSRSALIAEISLSISSNRGPIRSSRRSPASVSDTLRVVRVSSLKAEPRLQSADRVAQRRLGNAELGGSLGEAPFARDGDEGEEVVQVVAAHSEIRLLGPCR